MGSSQSKNRDMKGVRIIHTDMAFTVAFSYSKRSTHLGVNMYLGNPALPLIPRQLILSPIYKPNLYSNLWNRLMGIYLREIFRRTNVAVYKEKSILPTHRYRANLIMPWCINEAYKGKLNWRHSLQILPRLCLNQFWQCWVNEVTHP